MQTKFIDKTDRDVFLKSLALYDRDESELNHCILPHDTDIDAVIDSAFERVCGNRSVLPL